MISPRSAAVALEDSPSGLASAVGAGVRTVDPAWYGEKSFPNDPHSGPISNPAIRPGRERNTLTVRVRRRRVDVLVNGALRRRFFPFGTFTGRVQIQRLDIDGDGLLDVVARATLHGKKRTRTFLT